MSEIMERPPVRDIPVAVTGDFVLVQGPAIVVTAGAFTVSSSGFEFGLHVAADISDPAVRLPVDMFCVERDWRARCSWMSIRYSDGRACDACITRCTLPGDEDNTESTDIRLKSMFNLDESWASRWWVSPLPPPGPLELTIHLDGRVGLVGTASLDTGVLLAAAAMVEKVA